MEVSVVICGYTLERTEVFLECIESVLEQTYEPIEVVVVIDGNPDLMEIVEKEFGGEETVVVYGNEENRGISYSRTKGGELASGEIVAFIDDDAVAEENWIETLVSVYNNPDVIAAGGYVAPHWLEGKPAFFPEEFYWLVGCTEPGFAEDGEEVRNVYGSNISYRRDAFLEVGGYDVNTGRKGDRHVQAHEAPVGIRLQERFGRGMVYVEDAVVHHTLFAYRGEFVWLVQRSFWQGFSKRVMDVLYPESQGNERAYLWELFETHVPERITRRPTVSNTLQILAIFVFTAAVGLGYLYGLVRRDILREEIA